MVTLTKRLIDLHGREGLRGEQWFDLMIDDVLASFGLRLAPEDIPSEPVRAVLFELSGLYAKELFAAEPFADLLGQVHMNLVSQYHQKGSGQFFTPREVCRFMAQLSIGDVQIDPAEEKLIRICEPAVGAGGMVLAVLDHICKLNGPEALAWVSVTGIDIDRRCVRMYACQVLSALFVLGYSLGELVSYHGNTLGDPNDWQTVCHYTRANLPVSPVPADLPAVKAAVAEAVRVPQVAAHGGEQMILF
jgi:hypothetical protein